MCQICRSNVRGAKHETDHEQVHEAANHALCCSLPSIPGSPISLASPVGNSAAEVWSENQPGLPRKHMAIQVERWQVAACNRIQGRGTGSSLTVPEGPTKQWGEGTWQSWPWAPVQPRAQGGGAAAASLPLSPTTPHTQEGLSNKGGCYGLCVMVLFITISSPAACFFSCP